MAGEAAGAGTPVDLVIWGVRNGRLARKGHRVGDTARRRIPEATVARLPVYYRALLEAADQ